MCRFVGSFVGDQIDAGNLGAFGWLLKGNTIGAADFLGSLNAQDVVLKRNNAETARLTADGVAVPVAKAIDFYNVGTPGAANIERLRIAAVANVFTIEVSKSGTGLSRVLRLQTDDDTAFSIQDGALAYFSSGTAVGDAYRFTLQTSEQVGLRLCGLLTTHTGVAAVELANNTLGSSFSASSGTQRLAKLTAALNQTATAAFTALDIAVTGTGGSGAQYLVAGSYGGSQKFSINKDGNVDAVGGLSLKSPPGAQAGDYTALLTDFGIQFDTTAAGRTLNLPAAATARGKVYAVRANGANAVTVDPSGGETIDGGATATVAANTGAVIACDGTSWLRVV